jgi:hypothetical protein
VIIFDADDPLVLNGTYDREGYKPGERARIAKARACQQQEATMAKKRASKVDKKLSKPDVKRRPRQQDLPGTEDRAIKALEDIAASYADWRDRRMELTREEKELKSHVLRLMHKHGKTIYRHDGIEIRLVEGEEDVKVRIKKPGEDQDEDGPDDDEEADDPEDEAIGDESSDAPAQQDPEA